MKILFIIPGNKSNNHELDTFILTKEHQVCISLAILASLTPSKYEISILDQSREKIDYENHYDLVGITTAITKYVYNAYRIADNFRKKNIKVVLGGSHASALPEEAKQHADSVVIGEAEELWPKLLKDFENNKLKPFYKQTRPVDPKLIPQLNCDIFPKGTKYGIAATRGCKYQCDFCTMGSQIFRKKFRKREITLVLDEIQKCTGKVFAFRDNSLTIDPEYTKKIFKEMRGLDKKFIGFGNIDVLGSDEEFLRLAQEAGCFQWFIGFESISQNTIDNLSKRSNKVRKYIKSIEKIHDYGMPILGSFIFGFDSDNSRVFKDTSDFLRQSEIDIPLFNILTPYPGTPIYNKFERENRILTKDWSKYDLEQIVFQPKNITQSELKKFVGDLYNEWYSFKANANRIIKSLKFGTKHTHMVLINNALCKKTKNNLNQ